MPLGNAIVPNAVFAETATSTTTSCKKVKKKGIIFYKKMATY
jgi:hypothetical protein